MDRELWVAFGGYDIRRPRKKRALLVDLVA